MLQQVDLLELSSRAAQQEKEALQVRRGVGGSARGRGRRAQLTGAGSARAAGASRGRCRHPARLCLTAPPPRLLPPQAMLKSAVDESNHLLHEIGNTAEKARRTAVRLRGRETGALPAQCGLGLWSGERA